MRVASDVAALGADDDVDGVLVAHVAESAHRGGVHARHRPRTEDVGAAVAELELHSPAVHEVELLLLVVEVTAPAVARRDDDGVDAELRHADCAADLAEAVVVAHRVDVPDGIALALHDVSDPFGHRTRIHTMAGAPAPNLWL